MSPEFPIRLIFDDGECEVIETPEELLARVDSIDSTDPSSRVWIRDLYDRTVRLKMRGGFVEVFDAVTEDDEGPPAGRPGRQG